MRGASETAPMSFHLGKPILVMLILSVACALGLAFRPDTRRRTDLRLWVFDDLHRRTYQGDGSPSTRPSLVEQFRQRTGKSVGIELVATRAEDVRLVSMFMSDAKDVPDAVELEIGSVAKYFRPPTKDIGLLPLNDFLARSGWMDKVVRARFAPWSKNGVIFGVPYDVHPVVIVYRDDLFREAGIDLAAMRTWPEFQGACLRFQDFWRARGVKNRHAMELMISTADQLIPMLLQRHLNPIDGDGRLRLNEEKFVQTVAFYAQCVAGPGNIASQSPAAAGGMTKDLIDGNVCAFMVADWKVDQIKQYAPSMAGRMRMMPLPVFEAGDARTATWGGSMIGIPRNCKDPESAWKLIEHLYFSKEGLDARRQYTSILPPVITLWDDPVYQRPDPYFGGQQTDRLLIELAKELPERYVTPASAIASGYLGRVMVDAAGFVNSHPGDQEALVAQCRAWLGGVSKDLRRRIEHGKFDE
jgi:arabinosaccharide transport system substrate-binding protein